MSDTEHGDTEALTDSPTAAQSPKDGDTEAQTKAINWVSTSEAAARLKTTDRSVQRQCASGKLRARRVPGKRGDVWEVDLDSPPEESTGKEKEQGDAATPGERQNDKEPDNDGDTEEFKPTATTTATPTGSSIPAQNQPQVSSTDNGDARYIASLERENAFLRGQLEEGNRNAAELRAALRKALEIAPRQLSAPTETFGEQSDSTTATATQREAPTATKSTTATGTASDTANPTSTTTTPQAAVPSSSSVTNPAPTKEMRPLWKVILGIR